MALWTDLLTKYGGSSNPQEEKRQKTASASLRFKPDVAFSRNIPTPPPPKPKANYLKKPFIGTRLFNDIGKTVKKAADMGLIGFNNPLHSPKMMADIGKKMQQFPDTTIKAVTTRPQQGDFWTKSYREGKNYIQAGNVKIPVSDIGAKAIPFISSIPGQMVKSYGKTMERVATPQGRKEIVTGVKKLATEKPSLKTIENPAVQTALDVSDFIPGVGLLSIGAKGVAKKGIQQAGEELAEKSGKEVIENVPKGIPESSLSEPNKIFNFDNKLDQPEYDVFNKAFQEAQDVLAIAPDMREILPPNITGREAYSKINQALSVGHEPVELIDQISRELKQIGYKGVNTNRNPQKAISSTKETIKNITDKPKLTNLQAREQMVDEHNRRVAGKPNFLDDTSDDVLNDIRSAIQSGDEEGARALHQRVSNDFNLPPFESLVDEVTTASNQALKGAADDVLQGKASQPYAETINKFKNFLRLSKEKTSQETGMLFREHIPGSIFGQSSDEVASVLGKTESEFMQELLSDIENVASGKITAQQANRFLDNVKKAYKFNIRLPKPIKDFYNTLNETDYKVLRSSGEFGEGVAVSAQASEKTLQKAATKEAADFERAAMRIHDEWRQAIRTQTISSKDRINQIVDMVKESTDDAIKQRLGDNAQKVFLIDWRSPENVFKKLGIHEEVYMPLKKGQELTAREIDEGYDKMNTWFKELKGNKAESSIKIFDYLDGKQVDLSPVELKVSAEIKQYLQEWADKLGLSESKRITDYITHIFEPDLAGGKRVIPEELTRILDYVKPQGVKNPFLEERTGAKGYKRDVFASLDAYVRRSARALHLDKPIKTASQFADVEGTQAQNYLDRFLKNLQGRPDSFEKWLDMNVMQVLPVGLRNRIGARPGKELSRKFTGLIYRGTLGLNLSSALKNLTQGVNTLAELGPQSTLYGYAKLLKSGTKELIDNGVIDDMLIADYRRTPIKNTIQKMDNVLFYLFEAAEKINRGSAYFGGKRYGLRHGLSEEQAIEFGKSVVRKTQFAYGKLDTPLAIQNSLGKMAFQFSTFPLKQAELVGGWVKNKEYVKLMHYTYSSLLVAYAVGDLLGIEPQDFVFKNIVPGFGPIPELAGAAASVVSSTVSGNEPDWKAKQTLTNAPKLLLPAGVQADKVIQGLKANAEGGVYDKRGYMKYPVYKTSDKIIAPLLGTYRTSGAIEERKNR